MSSTLSQTCAPNNPDLNQVDAILGPCRSECTKFDTVDQCWNRRSYWSDAHCHDTSMITALDNGNGVCCVSWIRMAYTLNTRFTNCLYRKIIVVTEYRRCVEIFARVGPQHDFESLQIISVDQTRWYTWRPLTSYTLIKMKLASCYLLLYRYVDYMC